jgi:hypothetical protein
MKWVSKYFDVVFLPYLIYTLKPLSDFTKMIDVMIMILRAVWDHDTEKRIILC